MRTFLICLLFLLLAQLLMLAVVDPFTSGPTLADLTLGGIVRYLVISSLTALLLALVVPRRNKKRGSTS